MWKEALLLESFSVSLSGCSVGPRFWNPVPMSDCSAKYLSPCVCLFCSVSLSVSLCLICWLYPSLYLSIWLGNSPCICLFVSISLSLYLSILLNISLTVFVPSAQYLSHCICPFCSISLSLYLSLLFNISLPVSAHSAQYLFPCICPFYSISLTVSVCSSQYLSLYLSVLLSNSLSLYLYLSFLLSILWPVFDLCSTTSKTQPESKCPELLANYCDMLLRKTPLSKKMSPEEVERKLRDVVIHSFHFFHLFCGATSLISAIIFIYYYLFIYLWHLQKHRGHCNRGHRTAVSYDFFAVITLGELSCLRPSIVGWQGDLGHCWIDL